MVPWPHRGVVVVVVALALTGCATAPPPPPPPPGVVPDLRGTWTGTWDGAPLALVVTEQHDAGAHPGVYLGTWPLLGHHAPGLSGVLSFTMRGERVSVPVVGRLGSEAGRLAVLLQARGAAGDQHFRLIQVGPDQLHGTGESTARWGPRGAAALVRQAGPPR